MYQWIAEIVIFDSKVYSDRIDSPMIHRRKDRGEGIRFHIFFRILPMLDELLSEVNVLIEIPTDELRTDVILDIKDAMSEATHFTEQYVVGLWNIGHIYTTSKDIISQWPVVSEY